MITRLILRDTVTHTQHLIHQLTSAVNLNMQIWGFYVKSNQMSNYVQSAKKR